MCCHEKSHPIHTFSKGTMALQFGIYMHLCTIAYEILWTNKTEEQRVPTDKNNGIWWWSSLPKYVVWLKDLKKRTISKMKLELLLHVSGCTSDVINKWCLTESYNVTLTASAVASKDVSELWHPVSTHTTLPSLLTFPLVFPGKTPWSSELCLPFSLYSELYLWIFSLSLSSL